MQTPAISLAHTNLDLFSSSLVEHHGAAYAMAKFGTQRKLALLAGDDVSVLHSFEGQTSQLDQKTLMLAPLTDANAAALLKHLPWLQPKPLGLATSIGMGDRLGLATPGHVRAVRSTGDKIAPVFTQQSIREMARTNRTPQDVMNDATWGAFQEGWKSPAGADADHLKTFNDLDICLKTGYSLFTVDPGEFVFNRAGNLAAGELHELANKLPAEVQPAASGLQDLEFDLNGQRIHFDQITLLKAAVKYGAAVSHAAAMFHHLVNTAKGRLFEFEVSVDETEAPTSHAEHIYIAQTLKNLGVIWVSLAPRFIGRFEKGVDYLGDLKEFEANLAGHAEIARQFGPYKLSLHSGSDKFSIYPIAQKHTAGLVHLKTAGTSYLEALRTIGEIDPEFFQKIYAFACQKYPDDRASYHVSAEVEGAPSAKAATNWPGLLNNFDAREILHVTFGSVLTARTPSGEPLFYTKFIDLLESNAELYWNNLEKHFINHIAPLLPEG